MRNNSKTLFICALVLFAVSFAAYLNTFNNELFLDDLDYIVNNEYIRDWRYVPKMFSENLISGAGKASDYYRPLILVAYAMGYHFWELNPMGYHLLSMLFHCLCAVLLFVLFYNLLELWPVALLCGLLFAVFPVYNCAVTSAGALGILMGSAFMLTALILHLKLQGSPPGWKTFFMKAAAYALTLAACLCKETMVIVPGYIFLIHFYFISPLKDLKARFKSAVFFSLPYLMITASYVCARFTFLNFGGTGNLYHESNIFTESMWVRFCTFMTVLLGYVKLFFLPDPIHMERALIMPIYTSLWYWPVFFGFTLFVLSGIIIFRALPQLSVHFASCPNPGEVPHRRNSLRVLSFGILWFYIGMLTVSNIFIPISTIMEDGWIYPPAAGFFLIFSYGAYRLNELSKTPVKIVLFAFILTVLIGYFVKNWKQNRVWKDPITFYEHTLRYSPKSARFRNNLAMAYADKKRDMEAVYQYQLAVELNDQYPETHHNLGNLYQGLKRYGEAEKEYYRAIEMNLKFYHSYLSLAGLYCDAKRFDLAETILKRLIQNAPNRWEGYYHLGRLYSALNLGEQSINVWRQGQALNPYNSLLNEVLKNMESSVKKR